MSDGGRAAEDDEGLAGVLGLAALLPGCGEGDGLGVGVVVPEAGDDGRESEGHRRGLIEGEVLRDLCVERTIGVPVQRRNRRTEGVPWLQDRQRWWCTAGK